MFHDLNPDALANTIGWAVSTWFDRPDHIDGMRKRGDGAGLLLGARGGGVPGSVPAGVRETARARVYGLTRLSAPRPPGAHRPLRPGNGGKFGGSGIGPGPFG